MKNHKLKISCSGHLFVGSKIEVDGKGFRATEVNIIGKVGGIWVVNIEFLVKEIEVDIDAKVNLTPLVNLYPMDIREAVYKELKKEFEKGKRKETEKK